MCLFANVAVIGGKSGVVVAGVVVLYADNFSITDNNSVGGGGTNTHTHIASICVCVYANVGLDIVVVAAVKFGICYTSF